MKVILNENVDKLGQIGDVVEVKPGYARNFLLPQGLAIHHTPHNLGLINSKKKKFQKRVELERMSALEQKQKIEQFLLVIPKKAGETDTLFGSVTTLEIEKMLEEMGTHIERKRLHLDEPIKKLGSYTCKVKLMEDVEAELKIDVVKEGPDTPESQ